MSFVYNEHSSPLSSEQQESETPAASEQDGPSTPILLANGTQVWLRDLQFNLADNMEQCYQALTKSGLTVSPGPSADGTPWCNATWDTVLCWPATPGGQSVTLQCPPLKGLDPTKTITKYCHSSGHWMGKTEDDFTRPHGWTNFTMCFTQEVVAIMEQLDNGTLQEAQDVAKTARKLEFIGLGLSLISLFFCVAIFTCFRRLRVFRNMLHLHLMIALLAVVLIRLVLYIDLIFTDKLGNQHMVNPQGRTINTMVVVCELMFFLLEYFKSVAFWWMFLEGLYLHNQLVFAVFNTMPRLWPYLLTGYGVPLVHTFIWLIVLLIKKSGKLERCLGSYYLEIEFWILDGPRLAQLVLNTFFICNVIRVLWLKVRDSHSSGEIDRMRKSVKAAFMLIPLLGIPNIMQTIPFSPTQENITYFAIWTYCASFTYMYQGFMIAIIYCFTNREVQAVLKQCLRRYRLAHSSHGLDRHRGSHYTQIASPYTQIRNNSSSICAANGLGVNVGSKETIHGLSCCAAIDCLLAPPTRPNVSSTVAVHDDSPTKIGPPKQNGTFRRQSPDKDSSSPPPVQIIRPLPNGNCCAIVKPLVAEDRNHLTTDEALLAASRACLARTPQVSMEVDEEEEELDFIDNMSMTTNPKVIRRLPDK